MFYNIGPWSDSDRKKIVRRFVNTSQGLLSMTSLVAANKDSAKYICIFG